jgi:hypothetical protein
MANKAHGHSHHVSRVGGTFVKNPPYGNSEPAGIAWRGCCEGVLQVFDFAGDPRRDWSQVRGIDLISKAISHIESITQTTAANAEETASASEEIAAEVEILGSVAVNSIWCS